MNTAIDSAQRAAAKAVGVIYLVAMATSMFAELYAYDPLIVARDAVQTAQNIAASEWRFRLGGVIHLLTFASDAAMAVALYVVLKPVNKHLALLAAFWRLADSAVLSTSVLCDIVALRLLDGPDYLRAFTTEQLQALARVFIGVRSAGFGIGFFLLGLGSALFSWLWLKSGYIPRFIAAWGIFASLLLGFGTLVIMLFPAVGTAVGLMYMAPMFFYEVGLGLWLLIKGLPPGATGSQPVVVPG